MEKHQFKPFDKVLVRDYDDDPWCATHYSHFNNEQQRHYCTSSYWNQCVPYNENTAHLLGTTKAYTPPQPKTYWVEWVSNGDAHRVEYTDEELENFIKTAVLHNKDIQNFNVRKICG